MEATRLGDSVFGATVFTTDLTCQSNAHGLVDKIRIYRWPHGVSNKTKLPALAVITTCGRSSDEDPLLWLSWVLSYIVLCFPEFEMEIHREGSREFIFEDLPHSFIAASDHFMTVGEKECSYSDAVTDACDGILFPDSFPSINIFLSMKLPACATIPAVYAYCGALLYMAGRGLTKSDAQAITEEMMDKQRASEGKYTLTGNGRIGPGNYSLISLCWCRANIARRAIIREVASFSSLKSLPQHVVYSVTKGITYSGIELALDIYNFLSAFPWASQISVVRSAFISYKESVREVSHQPEHLRLYYKIIMGDSTSIFDRRDILPLAACAVACQSPTTAELLNREVGDGADKAVSEFEEEAKKKKYIDEKIFSGMEDCESD